jgi:hypothetical protein
MNSKKFHLLFDIRQNLVVAVTPKNPEQELDIGYVTEWSQDNRGIILQFAGSEANSMEVNGMRLEKQRVGIVGEHNVSALCGPFLMATSEEI